MDLSKQAKPQNPETPGAQSVNLIKVADTLRDIKLGKR